MKQPLVSVLVPIYNVEKYIRKCLDSLFKQNNINIEDIEYVFIDDCGNDKCINILNEYIEKFLSYGYNIKLIKNKSNCGLAENRNIAIRNSTGHYVLHVDSDDYLDENAIFELLKASDNCSVDIVISDVYFDYGNEKIICHNNVPNDKIDYLNLMLQRKTMFNIWGKLINRNLYLSNKIHAISGINQGEDFSVYPRLVYFAKTIKLVGKPLYNYVQTNPNSYCKSIDKNSIKQILYAQNINCNFFKNKIDDNILHASVLTTKIALLICSSKLDYEYINNQYDFIPILKTKIPLKHKVILILMRYKLYSLVYFILNKCYTRHVK